MAKNKKNSSVVPFFLFIVLPVLAVGVSSFSIYKGVKNYITTSNYFKVRELKVSGITDARYLDLMKEEILGVNIFRVDAAKLCERIRKKFPTFTDVTVTRVLPSQLLIVAKERLPVALLKRDLYYVFDTEGVALSSHTTTEFLDLPLIVGLEGKVPRVKIGVAHSPHILERPLALARSLRAKQRDIGTVSKIDASDLSNLCFYIGDGVQVRVGREDYEARLAMLPSILRSLGTDLANTKYIDLRPREPVVAQREMKKR